MKAKAGLPERVRLNEGLGRCSVRFIETPRMECADNWLDGDRTRTSRQWLFDVQFIDGAIANVYLHKAPLTFFASKHGEPTFATSSPCDLIEFLDAFLFHRHSGSVQGIVGTKGTHQAPIAFRERLPVAVFRLLLCRQISRVVQAESVTSVLVVRKGRGVYWSAREDKHRDDVARGVHSGLTFELSRAWRQGA